MNDTTLLQLKILVERAVRPVRASTGRKQKTREELLAHVSAVFEEEAKLGDESAALERVAARFGDPVVLTRQLQEAVPAGDRIFCFVEKIVGFPTRESTLRRATRHAAVIGALLTVAQVPMILAHGNWSEWLTTARIPSLLAPVSLAFLFFCGMLLAGAMRQALYGSRGRSWLLAGIVAAAAWLFIPVTTFAFCLAFSGNVGATFWDVLPSVPLGVLVPAVLALVVCARDPQVRYHEEWARLKID